jgi:alkaline phosphatase
MRRAARWSLPFVLAVLVLAGCSESVAAPPDAPRADVPKSVILLIGDGTGPQQFGLLMDWADAAGRSPTAFERLANEGMTGVLRTAPASGPLTDSAAGATALACGVSTDNGVIAMDPSGNVLPTCLEDARAHGKRTGLVTTATITDATPACFAAHVGNRGRQDEIAKQYVHDGLGADVLFGGGRAHFSKPLVREAQEKGWAFVRTREELAALPPTQKALGLFADGNVPYAIDRDQEGEEKAPTLPEMARKALEIVSQDDKGFFLMIEGGRIDHACHANDAPAALGELREFDDAIALASEYRAKHPDTLVVVTADHETGGTTVTSGRPPYGLSAESFLALAKVERSIEGLGVGGRPPAGFDPVAKFGPVAANFYPPDYWVADAAALERSSHFCVTFSTGSHSTTPVLVAAAGPGAAAFTGVHRNTLVGKKLREWMGR